MLNSMFGKTGKSFCGDVEFWHGQERTGWLMKQGKPGSLPQPDFVSKNLSSTSHLLVFAQANTSRLGGEGDRIENLKAIQHRPTLCPKALSLSYF